MRIIVSGATGLIGTAVVDALVERGDEVVALSRASSTKKSVTTIQWDPMAGVLPVDQLDALGQIDGVIHLAGAGIGDKRWTAARKREILESRVAGTTLLAEACAALSTKPRSFVSGSAIGYYGSRGDEVLTERSSHGTGFLADVCIAWERAASPAIDAGIKTTFARTGVVLSPKGGALAKQLPLFKLGIGGKLAKGSQWLSWISLRDEVGALLALLDDEHVEGPVNLVAPNPVTNATFTDALAHQVHRPAFFTVPSFALRTALGAELADEALLASARIVPEVLEGQQFSFQDPDLSGALAELLA
jgi:uncharacterized protein